MDLFKAIGDIIKPAQAGTKKTTERNNYTLAVKLDRRYAERIRTFERTYHSSPEHLNQSCNQFAQDCKCRLIAIRALNRILGYTAYDILSPLPDNKQGVINGPKKYFNHVSQKWEDIHKG